jgi:dienelactone hydrolase
MRKRLGELGEAEPLGVWTRVPSAGEARRQPFELSSRGDRVLGELWLPPSGRGPFALVLQQGASGAMASAEGDAAVAGWLRAGLAVASIDLPLHGARASGKIGGLLRSALHGDTDPTPIARAIGRDFARQAVLDLRRSLDALPRVARLDATRIAYVGVGLGAGLGAHFCAQDPRPRALVLAGASGCLPPELDPRTALESIAPRPVLFVEAQADRGRAEALHAAAAEPKQVRWFRVLPGAAAAPIRSFVTRALGLAEP